MDKLKGYQKKYLRGLAHGLKPLVFVGQNGLSKTVIKAIDESLEKHELVKVKFIEAKEKDEKKDMTDSIVKKTSSRLVGMIGHVAIFFREQKDPEKRKINIPERFE